MTKDQIAEKMAADKRKALLALAADRGGEAGACLSPAMMTAFVTGSCNAEEKQQVLHHISLCRRCYGEWLVLAEMEMDMRRGKRRGEKIPFYRKPANLAALVSAMAAAICVGLFLDINPFGYRIEPSNQSIAPIQQDSGLPAEQRQLPAVKESMPENAGENRRQPQPLPQATLPKMPEKQHEAGPAEKAQGSMPGVMPAPAPAATDQTGLPDSAEADAGRDKNSTALSTWEEQMLAACRYEQQTGSTSADRQALFLAGKRSLHLWQREQQATADTPHARALLLSILHQAENEEHLFARCGELLAIARENR